MIELSKAQQRAVWALVVQRQQVVAEADRHITEIAEALDELARLYAMAAGVSEECRFEQRDEEIVLVLVKKDH